MKWLNYLLITGVAAAFGFFIYAATTNAPGADSQKPAANPAIPVALPQLENTESDVSVVVQPANIAKGASEWIFEVSMDTHAVALDADMAQSSVLIAGGREYRALRFDGDPPGGHHRSGKLIFAPVTPYPAEFSLTILNVGGVKRIFVWKTK